MSILAPGKIPYDCKPQISTTYRSSFVADTADVIKYIKSKLMRTHAKGARVDSRNDEPMQFCIIGAHFCHKKMLFNLS